MNSLCAIFALLSAIAVDCLSLAPIAATEKAAATAAHHLHHRRDDAHRDATASNSGASRSSRSSSNVIDRRWILDGPSSSARRLLGASMIASSSAILLSREDVAHAAAPPRSSSSIDAQFAEVGRQERPPDGDAPFAALSDGVQIKDYRLGDASSGTIVKSGSRVELTMKGRLLNLNGVVFYDTRSVDPDGFGEGRPLTFVVGDGTALPGLERGILGMARGGIRRIIVPSDVVGYGAYPNLEPRPHTDAERRALDSVIENPRRDGTVVFDVKVERVR
jgi:FKBP-type peptidyl-prolyl cis-trans isomerase